MKRAICADKIGPAKRPPTLRHPMRFTAGIEAPCPEDPAAVVAPAGSGFEVGVAVCP